MSNRDILKVFGDQIEILSLNYVLSLLEDYPQEMVIKEIKVRIKELEKAIKKEQPDDER